MLTINEMLDNQNIRKVVDYLKTTKVVFYM